MSLGDFHFLWECLKVIIEHYWGKPAHHGSLCNLKEVISRKQVDKKAKNFSVADEFVLHAFKSHMIAAICNILNVKDTSCNISHQETAQWLDEVATRIVRATIATQPSKDIVYAFHRSFVHAAFLYVDLRNAIRFEDGRHIVRHWQQWLVYFLALGKHNYAAEAVNLICKLKSELPEDLAYLAIHNRTVNTTGRLGCGKQ